LLVASGWSAAASRDLSRQMMTTIYGIAIQAIFDPAQWTPAQQRKALQHVLALASIGDAGPAPRAAGSRKTPQGRTGRPASSWLTWYASVMPRPRAKPLL
jgi:hypothetical protein